MMLKFNVKNLFIAALGIIVLFLTSCGFFIDDSSPSADHKDPPKKVSQCELLGNTPRENNFEKFVSIERHFQRTLRYDCNNKLISDELETVKSPRAEVHIKRFEKHEIPENYEFTPKWNVYNRRTCGASGAYSASRDFLAMGLDVDMASALFTF